MNRQNKEGLLTQQPQLDQLLATNKTLAGQKRQFHRQKLRAYSQKAVKLRSILRQTSDLEQKRCLEEKLRALQEKQDAQITKLAKIDQIQKEIDQFITEEDLDVDIQKNSTQTKNGKNQSWVNQIQNTPADRLRTKSSIPLKNCYDSNSQKQFDFSRKRSSVSKKQENQQLLLKDSRQALDELSGNHVINFAKHREHSKNSVKSKEVIQHFSSYKKSDYNIFQATHNMKQTKPFWKQQEQKEERNVSFESVPPIFLTFVDKVNKFWPKDLEELIKYFKECEFNRKKLAQKQKQFDSLALREQKIKKDQERIRKDQERLKKIEQKLKTHQQRVKGLISEQRRLMENIDKLQKQHFAIKKQIETSFQSIAKSAQLISSSSFMINQAKDPIQINCLHSDSIHKFSVDSFDSASQGSLYSELCKFQKNIQKYLLSSQRAVMMISGEMQQNSSKFSKAKQQHTNLEGKKKTLQSQLNKLENSIAGRKNLLKELENGLKTLQSLIKDNNDTLQLKKAISQQMQQKCEKLKTKKKILTEKTKKLEEQLQTMTIRKQQLFGMSYEAEHRLAGMKAVEKELETKLIFYERDRDNRLKDLEQLEKKQVEFITHLQEKNREYEEVCKKYDEKSNNLSDLEQKIKKYKQEQIEYGEKALTLQQQLAQAQTFLQQQNVTAQKQMQDISKRSQQHLEIQTKITQMMTTIRQHQVTCAQLSKQKQNQNETINKGKEQLAKIQNAKQELEKILHEIIQKKQWMINQIQEHTKQLEILLTDLQNAKDDYHTILETTEQLQSDLQKKQNQLKNIQLQIDELGEQLESQLQQQSNILGRISQLKEFQKALLLQTGLKVNSDLLQGQLKTRVNEAVNQLSTLNDLKSQLKQCKYENRKLRVQNQRMCRLLGENSIE